MELFKRATDCYSPEQRLWVGVIVQMWQDLTLRGYNSRHEKHQAHEWFQKNGKDFRMVCEMAGLNADYVYERYMRKHGFMIKRLRESLVANTPYKQLYKEEYLV